MRTVTKAEAEQNLTAVLDVAALEPVCIRRAENDFILVSAKEFEEAQQLLHKARVRTLKETMQHCAEQAAANGFTEDMLPDLLKP
jgi:PHD/YefM family antitoxin component YafN of YafNO toxin-antitoxin module